MKKVMFELVHEDAIVPYKKHYGDAGLDIYPAFDYDYIEILPQETELIPTGIKSAFSSDIVALLRERGSVGSKGIALRAGVIDSNYRGEWFIALQNNTNKTALIAKYPEDFSKNDAIILSYGNAIAQVIFQNLNHVVTKRIDDVSEFQSKRGEGALGSSDEINYDEKGNISIEGELYAK